MEDICIDRGPWCVNVNYQTKEVSLVSADFVYDAELKIHGDFYSFDHKIAYAKMLMEQFNSVRK